MKIIDMDIKLEKLEVMNMLKEINDPEIIKSVKKILTKSKKDWWDDLTEEQKEEIRLGERQIENGEFSDFESFMKKYI